jgi:co-chaperonin GroES (HSP10)
MSKSLIGVTPLHNRVLVGIYDDGDTTMQLGGKTFFLLDDTNFGNDRDTHTKHPGIRPRWAMVLAVSNKVHEVGDVSVGDKVYLDKLTWSRGVNAPIDGGSHKVWSVDVEDILVVGGSDNFSDNDKIQLTRLYPNWESWGIE